MDKHDPQNRVPLMVDEWGIWTNVEPGTEPGFLYQQNSMRDALIATITFNIYHQHAERVQMANIAQTVNVLQPMILTHENQMVKTPTYHIFNMYKVHQDAVFIPATITVEDYKMEEHSFPAVNGTASKDNDGKVHLSIRNLNPNKPMAVHVDVSDNELKRVNGASVLTAPAFNSVNTFEKPNTVKPTDFSNYKLSKGILKVELPPHSVITIEMQ